MRSCDSEIMISNGSMSGSRSGTRETSTSMPTSPLAAISLVLDDRPGGAEVLKRDEQLRADQLEAALDQAALLERVADLHGRALVLLALAQLRGRQHARAADAVAAR